MASLLSLLKRTNDFSPRKSLAWGFAPGAQAIGWLEPRFARRLVALEPAFRRDPRDPRRLVLHAGVSPAARTRALDAIARRLAARGLIQGWRNERYAIRARVDGAVLFRIERAAVRRFGLPSEAAHLNGFVGSGVALRLWTARRSARKPIDPDRLDTLVGGGIAAGADARRTVLKESLEEAGLMPSLVRRARAAGALRVRSRVAEGLHDQRLHVFDLGLPESFRPENRDGEVAAFELLDLSALHARLAGGEFTVDASAVIVDFLARHGLLRARARKALRRLLAALRARCAPGRVSPTDRR